MKIATSTEYRTKNNKIIPFSFTLYARLYVSVFIVSVMISDESWHFQKISSVNLGFLDRCRVAIANKHFSEVAIL